MWQSNTVIKWIIFGVILFMILAVAGMVLGFKNNAKIQIDNNALSVRVTDTDRERTKGLSGTDPLKDNEGMLFVYDRPNEAGIWMKDMHYNLDIIWLDNSKKIIYIVENASPGSYPTVFRPETPARYVIEVPAGYVRAHKITHRSIVTFTLPQ